MLTSKQNVLEWYADTESSHWLIYYKGSEKGGQPVFRFDNEDVQTQSDALDRLRKAMNMLDRGSYSLTALAKQGANGRGAQKIHFEILAANGSTINDMPTPAVMQGLSADDVKKQVQDAIANYKVEQELIQMRKENAELKKQVAESEKTDPMAVIAGHLGPYLPELLGLQQRGIAGLPVPAPAPVPVQHPAYEVAEPVKEIGEAGPQLTDDEHARLSVVISTFIAASPTEWLTTLEKMAAKVQGNPQILQTIKMFL